MDLTLNSLLEAISNNDLKTLKKFIQVAPEWKNIKLNCEGDCLLHLLASIHFSTFILLLIFK